MLPGLPGGNLVYAGEGADGSWWMPLIEKAYAQWNETGLEGRDGQNSYVSLNEGWMQNVDQQVLGSAATTYFSVGDPAVEQAVIAALQANEAVTAGIFGSGADFNQLCLVSGHAYDVASYDPASGTFQLKNPWGCYEPAPLTWSELCAYSCLVVAQPAQSLVANSPAGAASGLEIHATALKAVVSGQYMRDAAWVANIASQDNSHAGDSMQDLQMRAWELVLAESGR